MLCAMHSRTRLEVPSIEIPKRCCWSSTTVTGFSKFWCGRYLAWSWNAAKALKWFIKISHFSIWKWIQKYKPKKICTKQKRKIGGYIIDETLIKVDSSEYVSDYGSLLGQKIKKALQLIYQKRKICW